MTNYRDPSPITPTEKDYNPSDVNPVVAHYTKQTREKQYGVDVREAFARTADYTSIVADEAKKNADDAYDITKNLLDDAFDTTKLNENFKQRLDDEISNLQPEWTGFKDNVELGLSENSQSINDLKTNKADVQLNNITIRVPSDYLTIQEALDDLSVIKSKHGFSITIDIEIGHIIESKIEVRNQDLSHITITSLDIVPVNATGIFIYGENAVMPVIDCLFDLQENPCTGYEVTNCRGTFMPGAGIINAGFSGLFARGVSFVKAEQTIFTNASSASDNHTGITARGGSAIQADGADVSGSGYYGASASSGSFLSAIKMKAENCERYGIRARDGGIVSASESSAKNCGRAGYYALWEGVIDARLGDASGSLYGFYAAEGGRMNAKNGTFNGGSVGLRAYRGATINADNIYIENCNNEGIYAELGCTINADNARILSSFRQGIYATDGSTVNAANSQINRSEREGVWARRQSNVNCGGATILNSGRGGILADTLSSINMRGGTCTGSRDGQDLRIASGGQISASETQFGTANTPEYNYLYPVGIIWRV